MLSFLNVVNQAMHFAECNGLNSDGEVGYPRKRFSKIFILIKECRRVIANCARRVKVCLLRRGGQFWTVSWSGCKILTIVSRALKLKKCLDFRSNLLLLKNFNE